MKKQNLLTTMLLLFALIVGSMSAWAADYTFSFSTGSYNSSSKTITWSDSYCTILQEQNSAQTAVNSSYVSSPRWYSGHKVTFTPADGIIITKIVITGASSYTGQSMTDLSNRGGTFSTSGTVTTWTGSISNSTPLSLQMGSQCRVSSVVITYENEASSYPLASISLSGSYPTTFTEKDEFSHEGMTVTAHYSGTDDTEDVTSLVTFSEPNMNTVGVQTVTVSYTEGETTKTADYNITINAGTKYTVIYNAESGTCGTANATETEYKGGVTLPEASIAVDGWIFAGWATDAVANTTTRPTLYAAGSKFYPTANTTLHAVYTLEDAANKFSVATANSDIVDGAKVVISSLGNNKFTLANNNGALAAISNFTPTDGIITCTNTQAIWTLNISNGEVELFNNGKYLKRSSTTVSVDDVSSKWTINKAQYGENRFLVKDKDTNYYLEHNGTSWIVYNTNSITNNNVTNYIGLTIYVAMPNAYNSNPTVAVITPTVAFEKAGTTLYLDGTTTYTNTASVTGIDKSVTYISSDETIATVNSDGEVTAVGIGTATITAKVAAELGVNKAASASYDVVVKTTTTIEGLKALSSNATVVSFAADLTDAVVTYVSGSYAYIQDASAAIMVNVTNHGLTAGQKINGAVSGSVKAPNQIDQISALNVSGATVTNDGDIPAIEVKTLAQIKGAGTEYDGKLVKVNGATVVEGMNNTASGGVITDDSGTTTFNIIAPNFLTIKATEIGNFTGFVSIYNGTAYRLNIYEAGQYEKTQNVATDQTLTFDEDDVELDEETSELAAFVGQAVKGAHTTVTYAIDGSSDNIIGNFNTSTGALTLNGATGSAIINVSAAAENVVENGVTTPYTAANASYMITVNPRYTVTFSVNGVETTARQAASGAAVAVPTPADINGYKCVGWSTATVDATNDAPEMAEIGATVTPTNNAKYYAVFANPTAGGEEEIVSTLDLQQSEPSGKTCEVNGVTWSWSNVTFSASANTGMGKNQNATVTFALPSTALKAKGIELNCPTLTWGGDAVVVLKAGDTELASMTKNNNSYTFTSTDNNEGTYTMSQTTSANAWINSFTLTYAVVGITYNDYRTSLEVVDVTIGESGYGTFCYNRALDFSASDVKAYTAKVDGGVVKLTKVANDVVPAGVGVVLFCETPDTYAIPVTTTDATVSDNEMVGVTVRTQVNETAGTMYNYILQNGTFYNANGGYLKANRAYLSTTYQAPAIGGARSLEIVFDEETTGIAEMETVKNVENGKFYNLNGQQVAQPTKGLYIVNGRKVVVK